MARELDRAAEERAAARIRAIAAPVLAPQGLRSAVAADRLAMRPRPRGRRRPLALTGAAAVVAVAVVTLVLASPDAEPGGGSVADAAQLALRSPTAPPPRRAGGDALDLEVGGVAFPDYARAAGWRPVGARTDSVAGRRAVTVTYARGARRVGYTIVDGAPLPVPADARRVTYEGVEVAVLGRGATRSIAWTRDGRTCVLATRGTELERLLDFASAT